MKFLKLIWGVLYNRLWRPTLWCPQNANFIHAEFWVRFSICNTYQREEERINEIHLTKGQLTGRLLRNGKQKRQMNQGWYWGFKCAWLPMRSQFYWQIRSHPENQLTKEHDELCLKCAWLGRTMENPRDHSRRSYGGLLKKTLSSSEASVPLIIISNQLSFFMWLIFLITRKCSVFLSIPWFFCQSIFKHILLY